MGSILIQSDSGDDQHFLFAMQLAMSSMLSMSVQVAVELNVFEIISKAGPGEQLTPVQIASQLSTQNPDAPVMLDRILRLLATHSILTVATTELHDGTVERLYGLGPVCKFFVSNQDDVSLSPVLMLLQDKVFTDSRYRMKDAILEGGVAFDKAHGMNAFEYPEVDLRFNHVFNKAMHNLTTIVMNKILETYNGFEDLKEVIDVGGGVGAAVGIITSKYPTIKGINFDLPHVIEHALPYPGVNHIGGNMFESVPEGEALFMKSVLHDWGDDHCLKLLKNCYKALPDNGKLIVVEGILLDDIGSDDAVKELCLLDVTMLTINPGGKERTEKEFDILAKKAGFAFAKKMCVVYNYGVIEFCKN